jgi:hypothetical protein
VHALHIRDLLFPNVHNAKIVISSSLSSSSKTAIYPNSFILEREGSTFLRKKEGWRTYQLEWWGRFIVEAVEAAAWFSRWSHG